jgi:hypothetical protein
MGLITQTAREYYEGHQLFTGDGSTKFYINVYTHCLQLSLNLEYL